MAPRVASPVMGDIVNVRGSKRATAIGGVRPGNAPATIPTVDPKKIKPHNLKLNKLTRVSAIFSHIASA